MFLMKRYFLILWVFGFALSGCRKFLEQPAFNNVSVEEIFKDFEGARTTVVGLYDKLRSSNYHLRDFYFYADLAGGNMKYSKGSGAYSTKHLFVYKR